MSKKLLITTVFILMLLTNGVAQSVLSTEEKKVLQTVDGNMKYALELLEQSVNINSGTYNLDGVRKVGALYAKELEAIGFTTEWITLPDYLQRAGHLVAYRKGKKGKKLFIIGHLDTVFEPDMPAGPYRRISDTMASGQGVADMKGGNVMIITALKALHEQGLLEDVSITVYFTGDEENAGFPREIARADFINRAKECDIALAFEGGSLGSVVTGRRGASTWRIEIDGRQGHSSGVFGEAGYGSIFEASRIINEFREKLSNETYVTFNPGLIAGGAELQYDTTAERGTVAGKTNIISPKTVVTGDLRFLTREQKEAVREKMRSIVNRSLPGNKSRIIFKDGIPSMPPTAGNEALARKLSELSLAMGYGNVSPGNPGSRGAGDISYIAQYVDCLDGLGAPGSGAHSQGERLNLRDYPKLTKRAALFFYRLTR